LLKARDYALTGGGSGVIIRQGRLVLEWGDPAQLYDLKSSSKSIGVTALGLALKDGKLRLDDPAVRHQPSLGNPPGEQRGHRLAAPHHAAAPRKPSRRFREAGRLREAAF
jgi:CubicO group peptidase (beta-lactamase class C family)